jgi:hypothetical protein
VLRSRHDFLVFVYANVGQATHSEPFGLLTELSAFHPATGFCMILISVLFLGNVLYHFKL